MSSLRRAVTERLFEGVETDDDCRCRPGFEDDRLVVDASDCPGDGRLTTSEGCRAKVVRKLTQRDAESVHVHQSGVERVYDGAAGAFLVAAGRFCEQVRDRDQRLADRAVRDPLAAGREAVGRADAAADVAAETGLGALVEDAASYESILAPLSGLAVSDWRVDTAVPPDATLETHRDLETDSTVRIYRFPDQRNRYVLSPVGQSLDAASTAVLSRAYERLADGTITGGDRAAGRAVRSVVEADEDIPVERVTRVLHKHTRGHGLLADLFADPAVSDVFVTAPAPENPLSVRVGDRRLPTNVRLTARGVRALASRYRRESGRAFSRADPTLDATTEIRGRRVRVAGVTDPASDGVGFAFRAHDRDVWTLPALVANGTMTASAAALLSLATERGRAILVAGPRGAGKTTLLGALLWELPPTVRTLTIEDSPELPVARLQDHGREVQPLRASTDDDFTPVDALRTALRLGDGAIAVGEVRGEEATVLYEAMRVGANDAAVLGTIHGDGAAGVRERVVADLGVPASSFGVTDLVVSLEQTADGTRRLRAIEEVTGGDTDDFETLYARPDGSLEATGHIGRGNSHFVDALCRPDESYAEVRAALDDRVDQFRRLADSGRTSPDIVDERTLERNR
ncbi:ATPase, T2SS/T4P/T4SS family [Salinibaculum rarum]|uniref:ATPase, T2SS/T4P/T4SS family n=1 Tax=Salinibaculum rarum TaxID=3058903 RepID=UPI00265EA799|nr:ATPase, T2SS/T4P/T4SS family [Salinibaculum sp. KK48]